MCDLLSAAPMTHCCVYCFCDSQWFIYCCGFLAYFCTLFIYSAFAASMFQ